MKTIKVTYALEIEVPEDTLVVDGDAFVRNVQRMLIENAHRGWRCNLRQLIGVETGQRETRNRNRKSR